MNANWKRPKVLYGFTEKLETQCGKVLLTFNFIEPEFKHLVEVSGVIGKGGNCPNVHLNTSCKFVSMFLQGALTRKKMIKKLRRQFLATMKRDSINCGMPFQHKNKTYDCCIEYLVEKIITELEK